MTEEARRALVRGAVELLNGPGARECEVSAKECSCRCGCKSLVESLGESRCDYCVEWHDADSGGFEEEE